MSSKHDKIMSKSQDVIANLSANDGGVIPPHLFTRLSSQQVGFVRECVDVVYTIFSLYGFNVDGVSRKLTYDHWIYCASLLGNPMKFVKYKIAAFYSYHKKQELPSISQSILSVDKPGIILGGKAYRWFNILVNNHSPQIEGIITSILYSKKGMPRPIKQQLKIAEQEAFEKLTTAPNLPSESLIDWGDIPESLSNKVITQLNITTVQAQLVRTVKEIFDGQVYDDDDRVKPFVPSTSANYINTRALGGAVGSIMSHPHLLDGLRTDDYLIDMKIVNPMSRNNSIVVNSSKLRSHFISLYMRIVENALEEDAIAVPLALPEALKTRVISKGPPLLYTALKPLQKKLWSILKNRVKAARLISEPVSAEYIQSRMGSKLKESDAYLSVDYSDATNEMFSWCSDSVMGQICESLSLSDDERKLALRALTGHIIEYDGKQKPQLRGQLMGSIVSFPILCIVNLTICRWSMEIANKRVYTLNDAPIAVNGDDGILRINREGKRAWEKIAGYCGLLPSVGKVYYSKNFLNMNSTTYNYHPNGWEGYTITKPDGSKVNRVRHFELVRYVNLGLLFNLQRSGLGAGVGRDTTLTIGDRCRELIRLCPDNLREKVLGYYLNHNRDVLGKYHIPWFIPEFLGGLGFPSVGRFYPCDKDLRLARKIYDNYVVPSKPIDAPWQIWRYAVDRMRYLPKTSSLVIEGININVTNSTDVLALTCVESLFRCPDITSLYKVSGRSSSNYFGKLERLWKKALIDKYPFPEPFNPDKYPLDERDESVNNYYELKY